MRQETSGEVHFRHTLVSATLVKAGTHRVLPLHVEEVRTLDGAVKQAGELNAAKRLIAPVHQEHPRMPLVVLGDDLYSHEPFILHSVAERSFSLLDCVKMFVQPMAQPLLRSSR
jgi:hypothetical protein